MPDATASAHILQKRQRADNSEDQAPYQTKRKRGSQDMHTIDQYTGIKGVARWILTGPPVKEEYDQTDQAQAEYQTCAYNAAKRIHNIEAHKTCDENDKLETRLQEYIKQCEAHRH